MMTLSVCLGVPNLDEEIYWIRPLIAKYGKSKGPCHLGLRSNLAANHSEIE